MTVKEDLQFWLDHTDNLINELIEDGTNEEVHHTIEHHFASQDFNVLEQAAIAAFKLGYEVEEPEEAELDNGEKIFCFDIVTEQALEPELLREETRKMYELAEQTHVEYDGWGTYFEE